MFIQTEATPNPATLKFLPGRTVLESGTLEMRDRAEAAKSPLAERLFDIQGVGGVFLGSDFITVTKAGAEWPQLKPAILGIIMEHFMSGAPITRIAFPLQLTISSPRISDPRTGSPVTTMADEIDGADKLLAIM